MSSTLTSAAASPSAAESLPQAREPSAPRITAYVRSVSRALLPWALPLGALIGWQAAASLGLLSTRVLPAPSDVALAFWRTLKDGSLIANISVSTGRALVGLAIGGAIGLALGVLIGLAVEVIFRAIEQGTVRRWGLQR